MQALAAAALAPIVILAGCAAPGPTTGRGGEMLAAEVPPWIEGRDGSANLSFAEGVGPFACALASGSQLPEWLALAANCRLTGEAPLLAGGSTRSVFPAFNVTITDSSVPPVTRTLLVAIEIVSASPVLVPVADARCFVNEECRATVATATGGHPPYTFQSDTFREGTPPFGTVVGIDGAMTGKTSALGVYTFGVCVSDVVAASDCGRVTLAIVARDHENGNETTNGHANESDSGGAPFGTITLGGVACTFVRWYYSDEGTEYQRGYETEWTLEAAGTMSGSEPQSYVFVRHDGYHTGVDHTYAWSWTGGSYFSTQDNSQYRAAGDAVQGTWSLDATFIVSRTDGEDMSAQRLRLEIAVPSNASGPPYTSSSTTSMGCPQPPPPQDGSFYS